MPSRKAAASKASTQAASNPVKPHSKKKSKTTAVAPKQKKNTSYESNAASSAQQAQLTQLSEWLNDHGVKHDRDLTAFVRSAHGGTGLIAQRDLEPNEIICEIPHEAVPFALLPI